MVSKLFYISKTTIFIMVVCITYYLLMKDNFLHTSISSIINESHQLQDLRHLVVLGLLPIYISLMIFGSAILGNYLTSNLQGYFKHMQNKLLVRQKK